MSKSLSALPSDAKWIKRPNVLGTFSSSTPPPESDVATVRLVSFLSLYCNPSYTLSLPHHLYGHCPLMPLISSIHPTQKLSLQPHQALGPYHASSKFFPESVGRYLLSVVLGHCRWKELGIGVRGLGRSARSGICLMGTSRSISKKKKLLIQCAGCRLELLLMMLGVYPCLGFMTRNKA